MAFICFLNFGDLMTSIRKWMNESKNKDNKHLSDIFLQLFVLQSEPPHLAGNDHLFVLHRSHAQIERLEFAEWFWLFNWIMVPIIFPTFAWLLFGPDCWVLPTLIIVSIHTLKQQSWYRLNSYTYNVQPTSPTTDQPQPAPAEQTTDKQTTALLSL